MNWEEFVADASHRFEGAGIDDARANSEYIAAHVCGVSSRSEWRAKRAERIRYAHAVAFGELFFRRINHEPLQYILGEWEFFGLPIIVRPGVLIPRPETEILVEETLREAAYMQQRVTIVDGGTGSGAIALALASRLPNAQLFAFDTSSEAIQIAKENQEQLRLPNVRFRRGNMLAKYWLSEHRRGIDLIVSNPPYVSRDEYEQLAPELRLFEPREALTDESSGYTLYEQLAMRASDLLAPGGRLIVEIGFGMAERVTELMNNAGLRVLRVVPDLAGIPRVIVARVQASKRS